MADRKKRPTSALDQLAYEIGFNEAIRQTSREIVGRRVQHTDEFGRTWIEEEVTIREY